MKSRPPIKYKLPEELVGSLMGLIRGQFCADMTPKEWGQWYNWIKEKVVLWPAHFILNVKQFELPGPRYDQIMRQIFQDIKTECRQKVGFWPGYLMKCVQDHWKIHWDEYYEEAKSVRNIGTHIVATLGKAAPQDKTVEALAMAHGVLSAKKKPVKTVFKAPKNQQQDLF